MVEVLPHARLCAVGIDAAGAVVSIAALHDDPEPSLTEGLARPAEITSVYVRRDVVGNGIGTAMVTMLEDEARDAAFSDIVVCSGPRNASLGYPFWTSRYGPSIRIDPDYWAPGAERVVWRLAL